MTPKQELFIAEYMVDYNAGPAAIRAGYSERSAAAIGKENLRKPPIAEAVRARMAEKQAKIDERAEFGDARREAAGLVTVPWVLGLIHDTATRCGAPGAYMPAQVLRAAELAGKHLSMFVDRVDLSANVTFNINLAGGDSYFERHQAGEVIEVEEGGDDGDERAGDGRSERQLRAGAGAGGQAESLGEGAEEADRGGSEDPESPPDAR